MPDDRTTYQRAVTAAAVGLGVQLAIGAILLILSVWSRSGALVAATWYAFGGAGLWLCLCIVYQQHKLERIEALEAEQLAATHGAESSIFETTADDLSVARRRLAWLYRWIVPLVSLLTSIYLIGVGVILAGRHLFYRDLVAMIGNPTREAELLEALRKLDPSATLIDARAMLGVEQPNAMPLLAFTAGLAILGFLISRYMAGMARLPAWSLLRAGAGYLMGGVIVQLALALGFATLDWQTVAILSWLGLGVPVFMIVIGAEVALNFLLDFYRPRKPGEIPRPAFDSRILSLLTTPESIARTISEAINYQFGFEITRSWFWQLFSRVFGGLILFAAVVMMLLSSIVIVSPNEQAVVTRFGRLVGEPLREGAHFKLPWPISSVTHYNVHEVRSLAIGSAELKEEGIDAILWTNEHTTGTPELLIVARRAEAGESATGADVSVSLVAAEMTLNYRIKPDGLLDYIRAAAEADGREEGAAQARRLRAIAERQVSRLLVSDHIDAWIGARHHTAGNELKRSIQQMADSQKLGVEVVTVQVLSIHPPQKVAEAFHQVIAADKDRETEIQKAEQDAIERLASVAGSTEQARRIAGEIRLMQRADGSNEQQLAEQDEKIEAMIRAAGGEAARKIVTARAYRWERENGEQGRAARFEKQLMAYESAPDLYKARRFLEILAEGLAGARKYLIIGDRQNLTIRGDFKEIDTGAIRLGDENK